MSFVSVKYEFEGSVRRSSLEDPPTFAMLLDRIHSSFPESLGDVSIRYVDEEGDSCSVTCDLELREAFRVAERAGSVPRFTLTFARSSKHASDDTPLLRQHQRMSLEQRFRQQQHCFKENRSRRSRQRARREFGKLSAKFVGDVSIPDASVVVAGQPFTKTWRLNTGPMGWPEGCILLFVGGDPVGASDLRIPVAPAEPNSDVNVSVNFMAPSFGRFKSYWRMTSPQGIRFGCKLWLDIVVVKPSVFSPDLSEESNGATVVVPPPPVHINVANGITVDVPFCRDDTVADLKRKIELLTGLPHADQELLLPNDVMGVGNLARQHQPLDLLAGSKASIEVLCDSAIRVQSISGFATISAPQMVSLVAGKWQYELLLHSSGCMQVGWITEGFTAIPFKGMGVGDDAYSWSFDGSRLLKWHQEKQDAYGQQYEHGTWREWREGDVLGCTIDCDAGEISFHLNGQNLGIAFRNVLVGTGIRPAFSLKTLETVTFIADNFQFPIEGFRPVYECGTPSVFDERDTVDDHDNSAAGADAVEVLADSVEDVADAVEVVADSVEDVADAVEVVADAVEVVADSVEVVADSVEDVADAVEPSPPAYDEAAVAIAKLQGMGFQLPPTELRDVLASVNGDLNQAVTILIQPM